MANIDDLIVYLNTKTTVQWGPQKSTLIRIADFVSKEVYKSLDVDFKYIEESLVLSNTLDYIDMSTQRIVKPVRVGDLNYYEPDDFFRLYSIRSTGEPDGWTFNAKEKKIYFNAIAGADTTYIIRGTISVTFSMVPEGDFLALAKKVLAEIFPESNPEAAALVDRRAQSGIEDLKNLHDTGEPSSKRILPEPRLVEVNLIRSALRNSFFIFLLLFNFCFAKTPYLLVDAINNIRTNTDVIDTSRITNNDLTIWINEAVTNISTKLLYNEIIDTINTIANQISYTINDTVINYAAIFILDDNNLPKALIPIPPDQFGRTNYDDQTEEPNRYMIFGNKIYIIPKPNINGSKIFMFYYSTPAYADSDSDTIIVPEQYQYLISLYVTYKIQAKFLEIELATLMYEKYLSEIEYLKQNFTPPGYQNFIRVTK